ncbi:MAG: sulfatase-like hydrolase/transferase, partial [Cyclobacteriaceae bacterium]|nr:sulfatase-like hydrolase/transferase [Cyclobacteriaceae bacterium]
MKKTNPLVVLTAIAFALLISCNGDKKKEEAKEAPLPNIVLILADDLGYGDISFLNSDSKINTPNIDRIGKEGIFFADAHSPSAVCTPTRYGLLTGQYAFRTHLKSGVLWGYSDPLIEKGQTTLAGLLKQKGYQTGVVGKWHLGLQWSKKTDSLDLYEGTPSNITNADNVDYQAGISEGPNDRGF